MKKYKVVSLFSGCGGLDLGFLGGFTSLGKKYQKLNFDIIWANDIFKEACLTYEKNLKHSIVCEDINKVLYEENFLQIGSSPLPTSADIVLGGFPCQDFSLAGKRKGFNNEKRGLLYKSMCEVIRRTNPVLFVAENVKGLLSMDKGNAIRTIIEDFSQLGYTVDPHLYLAADYGVPQMRERVLIVGTRTDVLPKFTAPSPIYNKSNWVTAKDAIGDLEDIQEGDFPNHYWSKAKINKGQGNTSINSAKPGPTMRAEHHGNIEYHWNKSRRLSAREAARIQSFPDDFIFYPSTSSAYKQIGNAVPPVLGWNVANAIQNFLDNNLKQTNKDDIHTGSYSEGRGISFAFGAK